MKKARFVKYLSNAHLNGYNCSVYADGTVRAENVQAQKTVGHKMLKSADAAQKWFDSLPGVNQISRLAVALENIVPEFEFNGYNSRAAEQAAQK